MIYENVMTLCKERGISVAALERACNIGNATIKGWKEGNPRIDTLKKVADYFGVTVEFLMEDDVPW